MDMEQESPGSMEAETRISKWVILASLAAITVVAAAVVAAWLFDRKVDNIRPTNPPEIQMGQVATCSQVKSQYNRLFCETELRHMRQMREHNIVQNASNYAANQQAIADVAAVETGFFQLALSFLVSIATVLAVLYAKRAAQESKRSADYSRESLDTARISTDTAMAQYKLSEKQSYHELRAYMGIDAINYSLSKRDDGSAFIAVETILKNYGSTPAFKFKSSNVISLRPYPVNELDITPPHPFENNCMTMTHNMESHLTTVLGLSYSDFKLIRSRQYCVLGVLAYEYEDYIGNTLRENQIYYVVSPLNSNRFDATHDGGATFFKTEYVTAATDSESSEDVASNR